MRVVLGELIIKGSLSGRKHSLVTITLVSTRIDKNGCLAYSAGDKLLLKLENMSLCDETLEYILHTAIRRVSYFTVIQHDSLPSCNAC